MVVVMISFSELLCHLLLAVAWHIVGPQPMAIITIFIKCILLRIYFSPRLIYIVVLKCHVKTFFNPSPTPKSLSYSRIFLTTACFSSFFSGEALNSVTTLTVESCGGESGNASLHSLFPSERLPDSVKNQIIGSGNHCQATG